MLPKKCPVEVAHRCSPSFLLNQGYVQKRIEVTKQLCSKVVGSDNYYR